MASPRASSSPLFEVLGRIPLREHELPQLVPALDATELVESCARHGLSAYVGDALASAKVSLPAPAQSRLTADARSTVAAAVKNKRLLLAVVDALAKVGITPVVLKGFGLASRLYSSPLVRPSTDVDVLVRPSELPRVHPALETLGLTHRPDPALGDVLEDHHHEAFAGAAGLVEAHFRLFAGFGMATYDDEAVQARARPAVLEGRAVRVLSPEDEFLYLAVHAANHAFLRASWLVDLQRFALVAPPNWARVAELAREVGFTVPYAAALDALRATLGATVSAEARRLAGHQHVRHLVHARLFSAKQLTSAQLSEGRVAPFLIRLWLVDSPGRALRQLAGGVERALRRSARQAVGR